MRRRNGLLGGLGVGVLVAVAVLGGASASGGSTSARWGAAFANAPGAAAAAADEGAAASMHGRSVIELYDKATGENTIVDTGDPGFTPGDYVVFHDLLLSAVENLVRNALRHTQPGTGVEVSLVRGRSAGGNSDGANSDGGQTAVITVRDHGPGVPEEALAHLFRPFFRVESARDRGSGGVGLGLAITQRAIEAHKGTVTAKNAPGGGLEVTIVLPIG